MAYPNLKQSVWLLILFLLLSIVLSVPVAILGYILNRSLFQSSYVVWLLTLASFVLTVMYAQRRTDRTWPEILLFKPVPWKLSLPLGVSIVGLAILSSDLGNLFQQLIPAPEIIVNVLRDLVDRESPYAQAFYVMVVQAPLTEEVFFRGVILGGLLAHRTRNKAIVWSAVLFALFHVNPWQFPIALILGIVFAWWVVQTGSLVPAIAGHALNNLLALAVAHLEIFGPMEDFSTVVFLPWWLNVCGIVLAAVGLWWFNQMVNRGKTQVEMSTNTAPVEAPADRDPV